MKFLDKLKRIGKGLRLYLKLYINLYKDKRTPFLAKAMLWIAVAYILFLFEIIPDFIPVLGQLDDLVIVPLLIFLALKLVPKKLYLEHYKKVFKRRK